MTGLAVMVGVLFGAALPAYADDPSLSVDSVAFSPGGAEVRQTIAYHNLPDHSKINVHLDNGVGGFVLAGPAGSSCSDPPLSTVGVCSELSGSGVVYLVFGGSVPPDRAFSKASEVATTEARIDSLSLVATGTVTTAAKADLAVNAAMAAPGVWISVYSYGPTPSTAVMLTVSGFQQPTTVPTGTCELDGLVVRCYLGDLGVTAKSNPPECGTGPVGRFFTCYSFTLTLSSPITPPPLTFAVSGPLPDPDNSNNSRTMFGSAAAPPAPNPGGGGGGSSADRPLFGPVPVSSGSPQPTPSVDLTTEASQSGSEVAGRETDPYRPGLAVTVGVAGFMVGACVGGAGLVLAWRRLSPRPVGPPDSDPGDSGDLTGHPLPAAPPVSGVL